MMELFSAKWTNQRKGERLWYSQTDLN